MACFEKSIPSGENRENEPLNILPHPGFRLPAIIIDIPFRIRFPGSGL